MAAYAWADLNMVAGAATIDVLLEEGARLGL
jgi:hypothetical protein